MAHRDNAADDLVERIIATAQENLSRFEIKLSDPTRSRRFMGGASRTDLPGSSKRSLMICVPVDLCSRASSLAVCLRGDWG